MQFPVLTASPLILNSTFLLLLLFFFFPLFRFQGKNQDSSSKYNSITSHPILPSWLHCYKMGGHKIKLFSFVGELPSKHDWAFALVLLWIWDLFCFVSFLVGWLVWVFFHMLWGFCLLLKYNLCFKQILKPDLCFTWKQYPQLKDVLLFCALWHYVIKFQDFVTGNNWMFKKLKTF